MRTLRLLLAALSVVGFMGAASAAPAAPAPVPVEGQDYKLLTPAQPTEPGKKVEVIEFFAYYCPHCNALDRGLTEWARAQGDRIVFKHVHVSNNGEPMAQQKLYYALESMGKAEQYQSVIFNAIHVQHHRFSEDNEIIDFAVKDLGMNRDKFTLLLNSFSVQSKVSHALQQMHSYQIDTWPTLVIDGKYVTSPSIAGAGKDEIKAQPFLFKALDGLVDMRFKERAKH